METTFFYLTMDRLVVFESLKTSEKLHLHGPLAFGQKVAVHKHNQPALYIVRGLADFLGGAVRQYKKSLDVSSGDTRTHLLVGELLTSLQRNEEAIYYYTRAEKLASTAEDRSAAKNGLENLRPGR